MENLADKSTESSSQKLSDSRRDKLLKDYFQILCIRVYF